MIVVKDIDASVKFYQDVLGLQVINDFGANKTLTGGISLQSEQTYQQFIQNQDIYYGGKNFELYFEEDDFDSFIKKLEEYSIHYVHPLVEHRWGQRVIRFYDLDFHIIEVGENIKSVVKRFLDEGMNEQEVADRMDVSLGYVQQFQLVNDHQELLDHLNQLHITSLSKDRIQKNLGIDEDIVAYCISLIKEKECIIERKGKNYYCTFNHIQITINPSGYTIITAHKLKGDR